jgi:hypothetical protein
VKTNSQSKFGWSEPYRIYFLIIGLALFPLLAGEKASAQNPTGFLFQTGTGLTTFTIDRSTTQTFQLDLNISVPSHSIWVSYFLQSNDGSGLFTITGRNIGSSPYNDLFYSDANALGNPNGVLSPSNARDLGAIISDPNNPIPPGSYFVATLTLHFGTSILPGTYHIFLDSRSSILDEFMNDRPLTANTVTVNIVGPPPAPSLLTAASRKIHGSAGAFDINLPLTDPSGVECRNTGGDHTLVFTFNNTVVSGSAMLTSGIGSVAGNPTFNGHTMTVELTNVADFQKITVTLHGVTDSFAQVLPDTSVSMNMLIGDSTINRSVNAADVNRVKMQVGLPVTAANFLTDINVSGTVTASDVAQVKANSGHTLP